MKEFYKIMIILLATLGCSSFIISEKKVLKTDFKHPLQDAEYFAVINTRIDTGITISIAKIKTLIKIEDVKKINKKSKSTKKDKLIKINETKAILPEPIKIEKVDTFAERIRRLSYSSKIIYRKSKDTTEKKLIPNTE